MTALKHLLLRRIALDGPISLAAYMAECLMHPTHGYYQKQRVFGAVGDFITAPEVSQMFGEMLGLWCADRWHAMGRPAAVNLIELGPGRGTLMADMLRATKAVPGFHDAMQVHFVEASAQLRALQAGKVPDACWHDQLADVPEGPALIVANEFFDALPIHQFEKVSGIWRERAVGANGDTLTLVHKAASAKLAILPHATSAMHDGSILELCPMGLTIAGEIGARLTTHGGAALIIDYGYAASGPGDSFQALKAHKYCDPFDAPGSADLTAHVAFDQLAQAAKEKGAAVFGPKDQGTFLMTLGLGARAQQLAAAQDTDGQARILGELKRLTAPAEMGTLFKVLALQYPGLPVAPGF